MGFNDKLNQYLEESEGQDPNAIAIADELLGNRTALITALQNQEAKHHAYKLLQIISSTNQTIPAQPSDAKQTITDTYFKLSGGKKAVRIRLADLRKAVNTDRRAFDEAIISLERDNMIVLYSFDNPQEIRPEDRESAINNSVGRPRHIIYIGQ